METLSDYLSKNLNVIANLTKNMVSLAGKTYDLISHDAHKPDASVIIAAGSGSKVGELILFIHFGSLVIDFII